MTVRRKHDAAQAACQQTLTAAGAEAGTDPLILAGLLHNLAGLAHARGDFTGAESLGRRSLRILEAALGPDDAEVGLTLLNLAVAVAAQGRQAEAAELTAGAVPILIARLPPDHPHVRAADQALARLASSS